MLEFWDVCNFEYSARTAILYIGTRIWQVYIAYKYLQKSKNMPGLSELVLEIFGYKHFIVVFGRGTSYILYLAAVITGSEKLKAYSFEI